MHRRLSIWMTTSLLCASLALCACDALTYLMYSFFPEGPASSGQAELPGLAASVDVVFDEFAVPHVRARSEADAFLTQGYLHARERLFQMELMRMAAAGRLSELFGNHPSMQPESLVDDTLAVDRMFRLFGFARLARESAEGLDEQSLRLGQAYVDGINAYLAQAERPIELKLLHHEPAPWTIADALAIARLQGFQLSSNMVQEMLRYLVREELGPHGQQEILPGFNHPGPEIIPREDKDYRRLLQRNEQGRVVAVEPSALPPDEVQVVTPETAKPTRQDKPFIPEPPTRDVDDYDSPEEVEHPELLEDNAPRPGGEQGRRLAPSEDALPSAPPQGERQTNRVVQAFMKDFLALAESKLPWLAPDASNSWALNGSRTKSGKPLLANDPHLAHAAPGFFYAMHLSTPQWDAVGVTIPGTPGVLIGRNRHVAWSLTTTFADTQDVYLELPDEHDPGSYMTEQGPKPFVRQNETIRVKTENGMREDVFTVRETRHGPVLNDLFPSLKDKTPLFALKTTMPGATGDFSTLVGLARAKNVEDARSALLSWDFPVQNWVVADDAGRIGYFPAGRVPRRNGWDGTMPVPGFTGAFEWEGYIPYEHLPQLYDPPSGRIVTANNRVLPLADYPYSYGADAMPGYRAGRILERLSDKRDWTADALREVQTDVYVKQADALLPVLLETLERASLREREHKVFYHLKTWDRHADIDSVGAALFFVTYRLAWEETFQDDLSPETYRRLTAVKYMYGLFDRLWLEEPGASVFDIKETRIVETRDDILVLAFRRAVSRLEELLGPDDGTWTWGRLHTLRYEHPFGGDERLAETFCVGPVPVPGARGTVWAETGLWAENLRFPVQYGPAMRMVADMADADRLHLVVDLGQSGYAKTPAYTNGLEDWQAGRLWPVSMNAEHYRANAQGTWIFNPAQRP